jgi:hypothetical protein
MKNPLRRRRQVRACLVWLDRCVNRFGGFDLRRGMLASLDQYCPASGPRTCDDVGNAVAYDKTPRQIYVLFRGGL